MTRYRYEAEPRPLDLGGGFRLRLLEDGEEVGEESSRSMNIPRPRERRQGRWLSRRPRKKAYDGWRLGDRERVVH